MDEKRIIYLDFLRVIGMFAVIVLHTSAYGVDAWQINTFDWNVAVIYDGICRWAVPVFVMVSGAIFLDPLKKTDLKTLYKKYILKMVIVGLIWSLVYAVKDYKFNNENLLIQFIKGHYHLWYLSMITGLYICTPLLKHITASKQLTQYFLILALIFTFLLPTVLKLLSIALVLLEMEDTSLHSLAKGVVDRMNLYLVLGYSSYYVAGYYLAVTEIKPKYRRIIYILGVFGFVLTCVLTMQSSRICGTATCFFDNNNLNVLFETLAVFVFAKYNAERLFKTENAKEYILSFAKYSLGVYVVHAAVLEYFQQKLHLVGNNFNPVICILIEALLVFFGSLVISVVLKEIPIIKKYI